MKRRNILADTLKNLIKQRGITQTELAKKIGVKPNSVSMYCSGNSRPDIRTLIKIASCLDVSTDYLLTGVLSEDKKESKELKLSGNAIRLLKSCNEEIFPYIDRLLSDKDFYSAMQAAIEELSHIKSKKILFKAEKLSPNILELVKATNDYCVYLSKVLMEKYFSNFLNDIALNDITLNHD